jgi:hypothetical protein
MLSNAKLYKVYAVGISLVALGLILFPLSFVEAKGHAQNTAVPTATVAVPTVTGTPFGTYIIVNAEWDQINVRECPNATTCAKVGVLLGGQKVPAKGRTSGGEWIQIEYPGIPGGLAWIHSSLVSLYGGTLNIVEAPSTPTPAVTNTIDPTLAAQFIVTIQPTRLPSFTPPPALNIPTFEVVENTSSTAGVPMGMIILGLTALGVFGAILSVIQGR